MSDRLIPSPDSVAVEVCKQRAICDWFVERHCQTDMYGIPRVNAMAPLELAYEALRALEAAGFTVAHASPDPMGSSAEVGRS